MSRILLHDFVQVFRHYIHVRSLLLFTGSRNDTVELVPMRLPTNLFIWSFPISDAFNKLWTMFSFTCIPLDIDTSGSSLIRLMNVFSKTVRTAEISFLPFKILAGKRSLWSYLEDLYWRCWSSTLLSDAQYEASISHYFTAFVFVENLVVPPTVFVSLFTVISMTLPNNN